MTQEEKELLLKDLSSRLPYGVIVNVKGFDYDYNDKLTQIYKGDGCSIQVTTNMPYDIEQVKPYLFPLSSLTYIQKCNCPIGFNNLDIFKENKPWSHIEIAPDSLMRFINWCYKNHLDIYGLIPMGLALDATNLNIY